MAGEFMHQTFEKPALQRKMKHQKFKDSDWLLLLAIVVELIHVKIFLTKQLKQDQGNGGSFSSYQPFLS
jgi:hypothetical protein